MCFVLLNIYPSHDYITFSCIHREARMNFYTGKHECNVKRSSGAYPSKIILSNAYACKTILIVLNPFDTLAPPEAERQHILELMKSFGIALSI